MQHKESLSNFNLSILWFGAAISLAEIITGALIAPLGLSKGLLAIFIGHVIGCFILLLAGQIGAKEQLPAIETTRLSFGNLGAPFFAILNIIQLVGWTGVMIANGTAAISSLTPFNTSMVSVLIAGLIALWIIIGFNKMKWLNLAAVISLFIVSILLGVITFGSHETVTFTSADFLSFGMAIELSIVMPLSWLPLISDYTMLSKSKKFGPTSSAIGYFLGSTFMYVIGLGAALYAGTSDIAVILSAAGLPVIAILIVILSTLTTTFLDVYSAAVSFNVLKKANTKVVSLFICIFGAILAILVPTSQYENFLYLIGSAFAPMFAILLTDYFLLRKGNTSTPNGYLNLGIWAIGVIIYRFMMQVDTPIGNSLPTMLIVMVLMWGIQRLKVRIHS
ncbi:putative hydroxymethylpyrimidine transporter CytX [Fusibacter bizertensis]|uniref:Hydroxymethylpyrimidine transporter CytX n=1 Tax=Fusibacter bizertensis TaxID=1488331 RepID=A0ABT6N7W2_9FIRM|nr:putative hydroxymethylpyrimidine transporter CytX [Fusibacter bizertensis]MDH8676511.1 putative hydroxymethylpyrimidine transporter CytX [Fusibacter bizertensis]